MSEKTLEVLINDVRLAASALAIAQNLPADLHRLCDLAAGFAEGPSGIARVSDREATVTVNGASARIIAALVGDGVGGVRVTLVIEPSAEMDSELSGRRERIARAVHNVLGLGDWDGFMDTQKARYFNAADAVIKVMR